MPFHRETAQALCARMGHPAAPEATPPLSHCLCGLRSYAEPRPDQASQARLAELRRQMRKHQERG